MSAAAILSLGLDSPRMTPQQIADLALDADREARRLARSGDLRAVEVQREADALADLVGRRQ